MSSGLPPPDERSRDTDFGREESWFSAIGLGARGTRPGVLDAPAVQRTAGPTKADEAASGASAERPARRAGEASSLPPLSTFDLPAAAARPERRGRAASSDAPDAREGLATEGESPSTPARLYSAFAIARVLLAGALLVLPAVVELLPLPATRPAYFAVTILYALATLLTVRTPRRAERLLTQGGLLRRTWRLATIGVDLLMFAGLLTVPGSYLNTLALFAVPVLAAGTLTGRRSALATAAGATLLLLGHELFQWDPASLTQTGLGCAGLFAAAWLTSELTARLAREERSARTSLALARQQALLNRLVIEGMEDGVLVVDREGLVRVANPAALSLIEAPRDYRLSAFSLTERAQWRGLREAVAEAFRQGGWPAGGQDLVMARSADGEPALPLRVRMRFTRRRQQELGESLCVVFLEDIRTLRLRARQDKLAAMGRVSAGIAHEIRNPLSAIAQANALLAEDLADPGQQRLARMVADNVERLRRIVDDVMTAAPGGVERPSPVIDLGRHVRQQVLDWARTNGLRLDGPDARVEVVLPAPGVLLPARMEPDHLARVLVNLLDNALHHSPDRPGAVRLSLGLQVRARAGDPPELVRELARRRGGPRIVLIEVASEGAPIPPETEALLFEPFFSTRSRGTGLGLYICRELCERHGASIEFRRGAEGARLSNRFVVRLPLAVTRSEEPTEFATTS